MSSAASNKSPANPATQSSPTDSTNLELIKAEKAIYPILAQEKGIQGQVWLLLYVSETGDVDNVEVISGDPVLVPAAVAAAKKWKYKPFIRNGKPIRVRTKIPFDFAFGSQVTNTQPSAPASIPQTQSATNSTDVPANQPLRLAPGVTAGLLIYKIQPIYPPDARANRIQGTVILQAVIGKDGRIKDLKFVSGPRDLSESAMGAVGQWRYRPYLFNGQPVEVSTQISVNYQLR